MKGRVGVVRSCTATLFQDLKCQLGEGALWDHTAQRLLSVDIIGHRVHRHSLSGGAESWAVDGMPGTVVPRKQGGLVVALNSGFHHLNTDTSVLERLADDPETQPPCDSNRFNDGKVDPAGRLWAGTMHACFDDDPVGNLNKGNLYMLDTDRSITKVLSGVSISNGIVWTRDAKTMYYVYVGGVAIDILRRFCSQGFGWHLVFKWVCMCLI